jgi:hypothetical protein
MTQMMALCPDCVTPLIATIAFSGAEFYCLDCGARLGFLNTRAANRTTALVEDRAVRQAEWDAHVAGDLLVEGGWHDDCEECGARPLPRSVQRILGSADAGHAAHATPAELAAHDRAMAWLRDRVNR